MRRGQRHTNKPWSRWFLIKSGDDDSLDSTHLTGQIHLLLAGNERKDMDIKCIVLNLASKRLCYMSIVAK